MAPKKFCASLRCGKVPGTAAAAGRASAALCRARARHRGWGPWTVDQGKGLGRSDARSRRTRGWPPEARRGAPAALGYRHVAFLREGEGSDGHGHRLFGVLKGGVAPSERTCGALPRRRGHVVGNHFPHEGLWKIIVMIRLQRNEWTPVSTEPRAASVLLFLGRAAPPGRPGARSAGGTNYEHQKSHIIENRGCPSMSVALRLRDLCSRSSCKSGKSSAAKKVNSLLP